MGETEYAANQLVDKTARVRTSSIDWPIRITNKNLDDIKLNQRRTGMRHHYPLIISLLATSVLAHPIWADPTSATHSDSKEIESTIREFFGGVKGRDIDRVRNSLHENAIILEDSHPNAGRIDVINTKDESKLLPPIGNDNWEKIELSSFDIQHKLKSSVATMTFILKTPLTENELTGLQIVLKSPPAPLTDEEKEKWERIIKSKTMETTLHAMLAKKKGSWKIVCLSMPK